jgi:hypothetical protein
MQFPTISLFYALTLAASTQALVASTQATQATLAERATKTSVSDIAKVAAPLGIVALGAYGVSRALGAKRESKDLRLTEAELEAKIIEDYGRNAETLNAPENFYLEQFQARRKETSMLEESIRQHENTLNAPGNVHYEEFRRPKNAKFAARMVGKDYKREQASLDEPEEFYLNQFKKDQKAANPGHYD